MMKKLLFLLVAILYIGLVSSQPPFQEGSFLTGLTIKAPPQQYLTQNQDYTFQFHLFNSSNGIPILNETLATDVACYFHLYNSSGSHIYKGNQSNNEDVYDFGFKVLGDNFSQTGTYSYIIQCNNTIQGGEDNVALVVTKTGFEFDVPKALYYIALSVLLVFLFSVCILITKYLPSDNPSDEYGQIISIAHLKYLRPILYAVGWALLLALVFTSSNIALAYLEADMFGKLLFSIYQVMFWVTIPALFIWILFILIQIFRDIEVKRMIERGVNIQTTP